MDSPSDDVVVNGSKRPDPTVLTTKLIDRATAALRELIETRLDGMDKAIALGKENSDDVSKKIPCLIKAKFEELNMLMSEKFHGVEKVFAERDVRFAGNRIADQETLKGGVNQIREIVEEKFTGITVQFKERDVRVEQTARDTKVAVDAALQAAEKAVGKQNEAFAVATAKSEAAITKQIDQIGILIATTNKATDEKIDDMKTRYSAMEAVLAAVNGRTAGASASTERSEKRGDVNVGWLFAGISLLVAIAAVVIALLK